MKLAPFFFSPPIAIIRLSDRAEVAIMISVFSMIIVAIYMHFTEFLHHDLFESPYHFFFFHILPSVWINSNMLYNFYKVYYSFSFYIVLLI